MVSCQVDVLEYYQDPFISTPNEQYMLPAVVRTRRKALRPRHGLLPLTRKNLLLRDRSTCQYCGARTGSSETDFEGSARGCGVVLTIDHVVPLSKGGTHSWTNCVIACIKCNAKKGNLMPKEAANLKGLRLAKQPKQPTFDEMHPYMAFRPRKNNAPEEWHNWIVETSGKHRD